MPALLYKWEQKPGFEHGYKRETNESDLFLS